MFLIRGEAAGKQSLYDSMWASAGLKYYVTPAAISGSALAPIIQTGVPQLELFQDLHFILYLKQLSMR